MKTHLDLFSGIGGFALACRWCGIETVGFCEIEPYAQQVIIKNFGAVPVSDAVRCNGRKNDEGKVATERNRTSPLEDSKGGRRTEAGTKQPATPNRPRLHGDIFALDGADYRGVWLLTGGFPCQPFSCAGKRRGKKDDRALWPQMLRVITEARPAWVIAENVAGISSMVEYDYDPPMERDGGAQGTVGEVFTRNGRGYLDEVLESIESAGYSVQPVVVPACAVDARHRRDRVWIVARCLRERGHGGEDETGGEYGRAQQALDATFQGGKAMAFNACAGLSIHQRSSTHGDMDRQSWPVRDGRNGGSYEVWCPEPSVGRVAHGIPRRVDRLKALGNSIVPQVAQRIISAMIQAERLPD